MLKWSVRLAWSGRRGLATAQPASRPDCPYKVLGVEPHATSADIKAAFYALSKKHHPDMNQADKEAAAQAFQKVASAYEILGNAVKRKEYDQTLASRPRHSPTGDHRRRAHHHTGVDFTDFERFRDEFMKRSSPMDGDPDEFFKRFGARKFRSRLSAEDFAPHYRVDHYADRLARERAAEERRLRAELRRDRPPFPTPTFEQLHRLRMRELRAQRAKDRNTLLWSVILAVAVTVGLLRA